MPTAKLDEASLLEALERARDDDARSTQVATLALTLASHHRTSGDRQQAWSFYLEAEQACAATGDLNGALEAAVQLSQMALESGDGHEAVRWSKRALVHGDTIMAHERRARLLHNLAVAHTHLEEPEHALDGYRRAMHHWGSTSNNVGRRSSLIGQGALLLEKGAPAQAAGALLASLAASQTGTGQIDMPLEATRAELLAQALIDCNHQTLARKPLQQAIHVWKDLDRPGEHRRAALALASALLESAADEASLQAGIDASRQFANLSRAAGDADGVIHGHWLVARALEAHGHHAKAADAWARLGDIMIQTGASGKAHLKRAAWLLIEHLPNSPDARLAALPKAEALYHRAEDEQAVAWCRHQRFEIHLNQERWAQAAQVLAEISLAEPAEADVQVPLLAHQARLWMKADRRPKALKAAQDALTLLGGAEHDLKTPLQNLTAALA